MRRLLPFTLALIATGCATTGTTPERRDSAALTKALAGRVAGKPVDCLSTIDTRESSTYDNTIVYRASGRVIYRQDLNDCPSLTWSSIPVFEIRGAQLCRGEIVRIVDRSGTGQRGSCTVGQFVPYTRGG